jgi:hypothetical protein
MGTLIKKTEAFHGCGTCEFWTGERKSKFDNAVFEESMTGKCLGKPKRETVRGTDHCTSWKLWSEL